VLGGGECMIRETVGDPLEDPGRWRYAQTEYDVSIVIVSLVMLCFACMYYARVVKFLPSMESILIKSERERSLFACFRSPSTCAYVSCCAPLVEGKNFHATEVCRFWTGCFCSFCCLCTPLVVIYPFIRAALSVRVLRSMGQTSSWCRQFLLACFCFPCELGRESMEVDDELGAEITCCNQLRLTPKLITEVDNMLQAVAGPEAETRVCSFKPSRMCAGP